MGAHLCVPPGLLSRRPGLVQKGRSQSRRRRWHLFSWQPGDRALNQLYNLKIGLFASGGYFLLTEAVRDTELLPFLPSSAPDPPVRGLRWSFAIPGILGSLRPLVMGVLGVLIRPPAWGGVVPGRGGQSLVIEEAELGLEV